ncbi:serine protease [Gigaspora margarita]|uniref:Serine protease n=1 Tax=Gigaspora margarita TaxID=4874 RepID=A0A8H3ZVF0_GIGMA|nr:serine protease [Gigaspora margarita]
MNKKTMFYFLIALVVLTLIINSSYSIPMIYKYNNDEKLDFWITAKIKKAEHLKTRKIGFKTRNTKTIKNTTNSSKYTKYMPPLEKKYVIINNTIIEATNVNQIQAYPIGLLIIHHEGELFTCTASVISTNNGNIGLTAAHCLFDHATQTYYDDIVFSPGYNNGQVGPLGAIRVVQKIVTDEFLNNNDDQFDWGMVKFDFNMGGHPLQAFTGALGWTFNVGNNTPTTILGYPDEGGLQNCPNDGLTLCAWQGITHLVENNEYYVIPNLEIGNGASGAPCMINYDPNANLGTLYSDYASFDELNDEALLPFYNPIEFQALLGEIIGF